MSQPTHETDVPQEEGLVDTTGFEVDEDDLPQEEGLVDTPELKEVDEEEDPPEGEEGPEEGKGRNPACCSWGAVSIGHDDTMLRDQLIEDLDRFPPA
jgi:hypothetical protein